MTTQTIKLTKPVDFLPKNLQKEWAGAEVVMISSSDKITLKRIQQPEFWDTWEKIRASGAGDDITQEDIDDTVREFRERNRNLKLQMRERAIVRAEQDLKTAEEWIDLENEVWFSDRKK